MVNKYINSSAWDLDDLLIENQDKPYQEVIWKKERIKKVVHFVAKNKHPQKTMVPGKCY